MRVTTGFILSVALLAGVLGFAQNQIDPSQVQVKIQKLGGNVYMLQFVGPKPGLSGGDVGACVGEQGILLVDTGYAPLASKLDAALKTISDKPVRYIINTHGHGDHAAGDSYFAKTATIIAQDSARQLMADAGAAAFPPAGLPSLTYGDHLTFHMDGEEIEIHHFAHGHTGGDSVVYFKNAKVVQMGDDFVYPENPAFIPIDMNRNGAGGIQGAIEAAEFVMTKTPDDVKIIPGHGDLATKADLAKTLAVLKETSEVVRAGISQGKSVDQMRKEGAFAKWDYLDKSGHIKSDFYFDRLYALLSQKGNPAQP